MLTHVPKLAVNNHAKIVPQRRGQTGVQRRGDRPIPVNVRQNKPRVRPFVTDSPPCMSIVHAMAVAKHLDKTPRPRPAAAAAASSPIARSGLRLGHKRTTCATRATCQHMHDCPAMGDLACSQLHCSVSTAAS